MRRPTSGHYVTVTSSGEPFRAFVPDRLPPDPAIAWSTALRRRFDAANVALGRLDAMTTVLPDTSLLLYSFVRKEAVLSSQIEGTQSSLADLLLYEVDEEPGVPVDDTREVSRCVDALDRGLKKYRGGLPICTRLLCEMHKVLLTHPRGRGKTPGELRRSQVWLGGTRPGNATFVPPPANEVAECMKHLEKFINDEPEPTPPLIKAALAHVQFETIHPFLDGNGRIGRLLIVMQLIADGILREPMLYPSLYFKQHRATYYELLNDVRLNGDWERWLDFFGEGIETSAREALSLAEGLVSLVSKDRDRIASLGRAASSALAVHKAMQKQPIATSNSLVAATKLTPATVNSSLARLEDMGVVAELTNRKRGRVFSYRRYVERLAAE